MLTLSALVIMCFEASATTGTPVSKLFHYIQKKSEIREGGSSVYNYNGETYVITVSSLAVGSKNEQTCKTVGSAKAKRDMLTYINGSEITSYTELKNSETVTETLSGQVVEAKQEFIEVVKERVIGTINQVVPLGGYYSEDRSVYYFVIYKII